MIRLNSYQVDLICDGDNCRRDQDIVDQLQKRSGIEMKSLRQLYTIEELEQVNESNEVIINRYGE
jgi:hypothetical protein